MTPATVLVHHCGLKTHWKGGPGELKTEKTDWRTNKDPEDTHIFVSTSDKLDQVLLLCYYLLNRKCKKCNISTTCTRVQVLLDSSAFLLNILDLKRTFLTVIFDTDCPFVQGGVGAALHNLEVHFHIQENVHGRKWTDVEQSSLVSLLYKQFTPLGPVKTQKVSILWHSFRFICKTLHVDLLHTPADTVEQIISPVVRSLKEAGEIILCACETFEILLIL